MRRTIFLTLALFALAAAPLHSRTLNPAAPVRAYAAEEEGWKAEFDEISLKAQDAAALTDDELKTLVERCDKLKPAVESLDESSRKVYSRRLKMCRDLFGFMLESRKKE